MEAEKLPLKSENKGAEIGAYQIDFLAFALPIEVIEKRLVWRIFQQ